MSPKCVNLGVPLHLRELAGEKLLAHLSDSVLEEVAEDAE